MENKTKRFYKVGQMVWSVVLKKEVKVKAIDKEKKEIVVTEKNGKEITEHTYKLWEVDVLKYQAKEKLAKKYAWSKGKEKEEPLYFARVEENATIPKKASEDEAGYDVWAFIEGVEVDEGDGKKIVHELFLPHLKPTMIRTGIATCVKEKFYLNFANERGSTGKHGMLVLSGIVDSTYRGEVFINICPLYKNVLITSEVTEIEETQETILYPYSKAICQMIDYKTARLKPKVIDFDKLQAIPSSRGEGKLGSSGH